MGEGELSVCEVTHPWCHSWDSHFPQQDTEAVPTVTWHINPCHLATELNHRARLQSPPRGPQKMQGRRGQDAHRYQAVPVGMRKCCLKGQEDPKKVITFFRNHRDARFEVHWNAFCFWKTYGHFKPLGLSTCCSLCWKFSSFHCLSISSYPPFNTQLKVTQKDEQFIFKCPASSSGLGPWNSLLNNLWNVGWGQLTKQGQIYRFLDLLARAFISSGCFVVFFLTKHLKPKDKFQCQHCMVWHELPPNLWPVYYLIREAFPASTPFPCSLAVWSTRRCRSQRINPTTKSSRLLKFLNYVSQASWRDA